MDDELDSAFYARRGFMGTLVLLLWVAFLFSMLFLGVKHFFVPALEIMSKALHLPDDIAGATLLAFGNGSPDVFTQIAAAKEVSAIHSGLLFIARGYRNAHLSTKSALDLHTRK